MRHQRYDVDIANSNYIIEHDDGEWVKAVDYDELVARLEAAEKERDDLRVLVALAAHQ